MKRAKVLLIGAGLLFAAGPAFAEGEGEGSGSAGGGDGAGSGSAVATVTDAAAPAGAWSPSVIDRPFVLPKGKIGAYGDIQILHLSITILGMTTSTTGEGLVLGGGYGVTDKITVGAQYGLPLNDDSGAFPNSGKGPLTLYGAFQLVHKGKMSVAASADFTLDFGGDDGMGGSATTKTLHAGLGARYNVAPKIAVFTGGGSDAGGGFTLPGIPLGPGPVGQHLSISLESNGPIDFSIPIGVGFQATPQLMAYVATRLAVIHIANAQPMADAVAFFGTDAGGIPLTLGGLFSVNKNLDAGASLIFPDAKHAGDLWGIGISGRWYN